MSGTTRRRAFILGAGMTGVAAGAASGLPVYEAEENPGGICASYYVRPGIQQRLHAPPADGEAYRFEIGGGHWIFGGDAAIAHLIRRLAPVRHYRRRSSVFFPGRQLFVPYPLQYHLSHLPAEIRDAALVELLCDRELALPVTMQDWLRTSFGDTLADLFFGPFHDCYTAGLYRSIAPQDGYKSPVDAAQVRAGAQGSAAPAGYNVAFVYPEEGLSVVAQRLAAQADVRYGKRVTAIDVDQRVVAFADGTAEPYGTLVSTLPLNRMMQLTGLAVEPRPDPSTSVLVLNIGAVRGRRCPDDHWLYLPQSQAGVHRVGFYSNVDPSFLPRSAQGRNDRVSIYVEKGYRDGAPPSDAEVSSLTAAVVAELQQWEFITEVEVADPTWVPVAYTWSWPDSGWVRAATAALEKRDVLPVGRYARWRFQGIADSIRDGLVAGAALRAAAAGVRSAARPGAAGS